MKHKNLYDEKEGTEGNELKAAKEKTPEKSDVGTVESIYDLFKPNKRLLTYAEYKMLRSQGKIFIDPMSGCMKVIESIYDLFKPNKRLLTYAEYKMLRSQGKIFIDPMSGCVKVIDE